MIQLTLNLPDHLAQQAEDYAKAHGKTLAALVEDTLRSLTTKPKLTVEILPPQETAVSLGKQAGATTEPETTPVMPALADLSPQVRKLLGCITLPPDVDYRDVVTDALLEKYGA